MSARWKAVSLAEILDEYYGSGGETDTAKLWPMVRRDTQTPSDEDWTNWMLLGGRGSGKTRAGAEWVRGLATGKLFYGGKEFGRFALVGETYADAREVMVEGESGLLAIHSNEDRPKWQSSRRRLEWNNGAIAQLFSSEDPDALRGPQFSAAWGDAKTIWASLIAVIAAIASVFGFNIDEASRVQLADVAMQLVTVAASVLAVFGRLAATSRIE